MALKMEDMGIDLDKLLNLHFEQKMGIIKITKELNMKSPHIISRWFKENNIEINHYYNNMKYEINSEFFDNINSNEKAYWMGFIWCDGTTIVRKSKEFIINLSQIDDNHLSKFLQALESNYPIDRFVVKGTLTGDLKTSRLRIGNGHFVSVLVDRYGLIPHRTDVSKLTNLIPKHYQRDFIRGILDADGSVSHYFVKDKLAKNGIKNVNVINFNTYKGLCEYIQNHFYENELIKNRSVIKHRSGDCYKVEYHGRIQVPRLLDYLYKDSYPYLDRKYEKYIEIIDGRRDGINS